MPGRTRSYCGRSVSQLLRAVNRVGIVVCFLSPVLGTGCSVRRDDADTLTDRIVATSRRLTESAAGVEVARYRPRVDMGYTVVILPPSGLSGDRRSQLETLGVNGEQAKILEHAQAQWRDHVVVAVFLGDHFSLTDYLGKYVDVPRC